MYRFSIPTWITYGDIHNSSGRIFTYEHFGGAQDNPGKRFTEVCSDVVGGHEKYN